MRAKPIDPKLSADLAGFLRALASLEASEKGRLHESWVRVINTAAHEFITPLTPAIIQVRLLESGLFGTLTPRQSQSLHLVRLNLQRTIDIGGFLSRLAEGPPVAA